MKKNIKRVIAGIGLAAITGIAALTMTGCPQPTDGGGGGSTKLSPTELQTAKDALNTWIGGNPTFITGIFGEVQFNQIAIEGMDQQGFRTLANTQVISTLSDDFATVNDAVNAGKKAIANLLNSKVDEFSKPVSLPASELSAGNAMVPVTGAWCPAPGQFP